MRQKDFPLLRDRRSPAVLDVEDGEIDEEEEMDRNVIALEDTHTEIARTGWTSFVNASVFLSRDQDRVGAPSASASAAGALAPPPPRSSFSPQARFRCSPLPTQHSRRRISGAPRSLGCCRGLHRND